jgi:hypothetical protein
MVADLENRGFVDARKFLSMQKEPDQTDLVTTFFIQKFDEVHLPMLNNEFIKEEGDISRASWDSILRMVKRAPPVEEPIRTEIYRCDHCIDENTGDYKEFRGPRGLALHLAQSDECLQSYIFDGSISDEEDEHGNPVVDANGAPVKSCPWHWPGCKHGKKPRPLCTRCSGRYGESQVQTDAKIVRSLDSRIQRVITTETGMPHLRYETRMMKAVRPRQEGMVPIECFKARAPACAFPKIRTTVGWCEYCIEMICVKPEEERFIKI